MQEPEEMTTDELNAWVEAAAEGDWEPNDDVEPAPSERMVMLSLRMPAPMLEELKAAAAKHGHPYQRYMRSLLLLALRMVQEGGVADPMPTDVRLTPQQVRELAEHGSVTLRLRAS